MSFQVRFNDQIFRRGVCDVCCTNRIEVAKGPAFEEKRSQALLLGYDGALALAHAIQGQPTAQNRARLGEYLRLLDLRPIEFPADPMGPQRDAEPASLFAQEVVGTMEARDVRLQRAFALGWWGVISLNTPSLRPAEFDLRQFAAEAGFTPRPEMEDSAYLEMLVEQARAPVASGKTDG